MMMMMMISSRSRPGSGSGADHHQGRVDNRKRAVAWNWARGRRQERERTREQLTPALSLLSKSNANQIKSKLEPVAESKQIGPKLDGLPNVQRVTHAHQLESRPPPRSPNCPMNTLSCGHLVSVQSSWVESRFGPIKSRKVKQTDRELS